MTTLGLNTSSTEDGTQVLQFGADASLDVGQAAISDGFFTVYHTTIAIAYSDSTNGDLKYAQRNGITWAPDGTRVAYSSGGSIWTVSVSGGQPRRLTHAAPGSGDQSDLPFETHQILSKKRARSQLVTTSSNFRCSVPRKWR